MCVANEFGGRWTEEKLERLRKYLVAYLTIMNENPRAQHFKTYYIDAFAGAGSRSTPAGDKSSVGPSLFDEIELQDARTFQLGSAQIALSLEESFDEYVFVDVNRSYVHELELLKAKYPAKAALIKPVHQEANILLQSWCRAVNTRNERAVVFLDPYGMSVEWRTIEAIARTQAVDLWILFPLGVGVNRLLTRKQPPPKAWADKLTSFFGTDEWKGEFYQPSQQPSLFPDLDPTLKKEADFDSIGRFFVRRLKRVFADVADNYYTLRNSRNSPLFLLYFAAANPKGAPTAIKIANHILGT